VTSLLRVCVRVYYIYIYILYIYIHIGPVRFRDVVVERVVEKVVTVQVCVCVCVCVCVFINKRGSVRNVVDFFLFR
jgi:hypothetical protein